MENGNSLDTQVYCSKLGLASKASFETRVFSFESALKLSNCQHY